MNTIKTDRKKDKKALELLNNKLRVKYPKNSFIQFAGSHNKGEKHYNVSCTWYDKVGGFPRMEKNTRYNPPEWQNIPVEKAEEISEMFDGGNFTCLVYVSEKDMQKSVSAKNGK